MQALVYKSTGSWYILQNESGEVFKARIKGKFKIDNITSTNPIAVGDIVNIQPEPEEDAWMISEIFERKNYINRRSPHNIHRHHIVASNLDQSLLFATLREPKTSLGFIDRFLITSEAYQVPAIIVFNKTDVWRTKEAALFERVNAIYSTIGYNIFKMSLETGEGVDEIKKLLQNKTTLLSGHSGVGKSSFINKIFPDKTLKTEIVSEWSGKGQHTTTFAEMFDLPEGGRIIDTPGIREMGLVDIDKAELSHYFPEMKAVLGDCKYNDCVHYDEPGCAVKEAVNEGKISEERYLSYLNIKDSIVEKGY